MNAPVYDDEDVQDKLTESEEQAAQRDKETAELNANFEAASAEPSSTGRLADRGPADTAPDDQLNKGYTGAEKKSLLSKVGNTLKPRRRATIMWAVGLISGITLFGGFAGFLQVFNLDNFLTGVEDRAFVRNQVSMANRSSKWINAYLTMRLADIDDESGKPINGSKWREDDNLYFRSGKVDNDNPFTDWYKTLRTSSFEQDVFEKNGIRFTSVAYKEGNSIRFRPAIITVDNRAMGGMYPVDAADLDALKNGDESRLDNFLRDAMGDDNFDGARVGNLSYDQKLNILKPIDAADLDALKNGDMKAINNYMGSFIKADTLDNDKAARRAIKAAVEDNTKSWQWAKRLYLRKSIQNMTGVRSWRFFENTRNTADEKLLEMKNKYLAAAIPDDSKSGRFLLCLFGINTCKASTDYAADNKNPTPDANTPKEGGASLANNEDGTPGSKIDTGQAGEIAETAGKEVAEQTAQQTSKEITAETAGLFTKKILAQVISKANIASSIASLIDSLARIDKVVASGAITAFVAAAKTQQVIGFYTTTGIARDQIRSGELTNTEYDNFMTMVDGIGNNQAWSYIDGEPSAVATVSAAAEINTSDQCSDEHLAQIKATDYVYVCPQYQIGGDSSGSAFEAWWIQNISSKFGGVFEVWLNSVGKIIAIGDEFMSTIFSALRLDDLFTATLSAFGLQDNLESVTAWAVAKVSEASGAGPMVEDPSGPTIGIMVAAGATAAAESMARIFGGSVTTETSRAYSSLAVQQYTTEVDASMSMYERYLSLENPQSLASQQLFAVTNNGSLRSADGFLNSLASSIMNLPSVLTSPVRAAGQTVTGYELSGLYKAKTYDIPQQCQEIDPLTMTTADMTNAAQLGVLSSGDLTWDLLGNSDAFWAKVYEDENLTTETADKIYNCALLDSVVTGSLGAPYGFDNGNTFYSSGATTNTSADTQTNTTPSANVPSGSKIELATLILGDDSNITDQTGQIRQTAAGTFDQLDIRLLQTLAGLRQNTFTITSLWRSAAVSSATSVHPKGEAADISGRVGINGVTFASLPGSSTPAYFTGSYGWQVGHNDRIQAFINQAAALLPEGCQIGVPNQDYVDETRKVLKSGCVAFIDKGTGPHIHLGVAL